MSLRDKATLISEEFYSTSLKLGSTAAYIGATPSELDALLSLSELDDEVLEKVSETNPPKTTWMMLANASDEELDVALSELRNRRTRDDSPRNETLDERVFSAMVQIAGPTQEQILSVLKPDIISAMVKRAESYNTLAPKNLSALKSFASWRKRGKPLTEKQTAYLKSILTQLVDSSVIVRDSIDGDKEACDFVLDTLEM